MHRSRRAQQAGSVDPSGLDRFHSSGETIRSRETWRARKEGCEDFHHEHPHPSNDERASCVSMARLLVEHLCCDLLVYASVCRWPFGQGKGVWRSTLSKYTIDQLQWAGHSEFPKMSISGIAVPYIMCDYYEGQEFNLLHLLDSLLIDSRCC